MKHHLQLPSEFQIHHDMLIHLAIGASSFYNLPAAFQIDDIIWSQIGMEIHIDTLSTGTAEHIFVGGGSGEEAIGLCRTGCGGLSFTHDDAPRSNAK